MGEARDSQGFVGEEVGRVKAVIQRPEEDEKQHKDNWAWRSHVFQITVKESYGEEFNQFPP